MTDMLDGDELIYGGKYSLQLKNRENKGRMDGLEASNEPSESILSSG